MTPAFECFIDGLVAIPEPIVLEIGTRRSDPMVPTHHRSWFPDDADYTMLDISEGYDVDIVGDAHDLPFRENEFDAVVACSVFEHLRRPWIAAREIMRVLAPHGRAFVQTHQTFPLHAYPDDYFRFSAEALMGIFLDAKAQGIASYSYPATIVPPADVTNWNPDASAWLNVEICAWKEEV